MDLGTQLRKQIDQAVRQAMELLLERVGEISNSFVDERYVQEGVESDDIYDQIVNAYVLRAIERTF